MLALLLALAPFLLHPPAARAAVRFDGSDDVAHWDNTPAGLNFTNVISVSIWYTQEAGNNTAGELVGKGRLKSGNVSHWQIRNNSGRREFYFANPAATFHIWSTTATTYSVPTNVWIHLAMRYDWTDSNSMVMWLDGVRVAGAWSAGAANLTGLTNNEPFRIGTTYAGSTWRGQAQECAVWNALLTDDEVARLARSRQAATPLRVRRSALRGYWPLRREFPHWTTASGTNTLKDWSGYEQHLTPFNSPQFRPSHLAAP